VDIGVGREGGSGVPSTTVVVFITDVVGVGERALLISDVVHGGHG